MFKLMTGAAKAMPGIRLATKVVIVGILILPFALFFFNVIRFAVDIPVQDDYGIFVGFILGWLKAGGLIERLGLIFVQQNEHRVAFARLVTLAEYSLTGKVNFSVLTVFGTIGWGLSVALLCYVLAKKYSLSIVEVLPIPYILFMFTQFNNMFMATTAITFYSSILFSLLLFLSLVKKKTILACLLFIIALFTNGNGVLLFPVGVLYLLLERRWREAGTYGASCLVFTLLFFLNYQRPEGLSFAAALRNLETLVSFPFAFLGNIVPSVDIALILGTVVVLALVYFVIFRTREHFLFLTAIWLLGTAALVALTRNSLGLEEAVSSRYAQYSLLAVILVYAWLLIAVRANRSKAFSPSRVTALAFVVSAALFFGSVYKYESIGFFTKIEQDKIAGMATFASSGDNSRLTIPDQFKDGVQKALVEARQLGFYDFKCLLEVRYPVLSVAHVEPLGDYLGNVEEFDGSHISGWAVIPNLNSAKSVIFILLQNQDRTLELQPIRVKRTDVSYVYNNGLYTFSGYEAYLAAYSVPVGIYTIGILVVNGDNQALHQTGQEFSAP